MDESTVELSLTADVTGLLDELDRAERVFEEFAAAAVRASGDFIPSGEALLQPLADMCRELSRSLQDGFAGFSGSIGTLDVSAVEQACRTAGREVLQLRDQLMTVSEAAITLAVDNRSALQAISEVRARLIELRDANWVSDFVINMKMAASPVGSFTEKFDYVMSRFAGIPAGATFTVDFLTSLGIPISDAADLFKSWQGVATTKAASESYQQTAWAYDDADMPWFGNLYRDKSDAMYTQYQDQYTQFAGKVAESLEGQEATQPAQRPVTLSFGPITIQIQSSGDAKDDAITLADRMDEELATMVIHGRSKLVAAIGEAL